MLYGLMAVVLMAMDHRGHYVPKVRSLADHAIEPLYHLVEWPNRALRNLYGQFQSNRTLRHRNEELQQQLLGQQADSPSWCVLTSILSRTRCSSTAARTTVWCLARR